MHLVLACTNVGAVGLVPKHSTRDGLVNSCTLISIPQNSLRILRCLIGDKARHSLVQATILVADVAGGTWANAMQDVLWVLACMVCCKQIALAIVRLCEALQVMTDFESG